MYRLFYSRYVVRKRSYSHKARTSVGHYLVINFICLLASSIVFIGSNYLLQARTPCANSKTCTSDLSESIDNDSVGIFAGRQVIPPKIDMALDSRNTSVLGTDLTSEEKHIYVDLSKQKLYAYEGTGEFMQTYIASGKWGRTPVGNFNIWSKLRATRMAGGQGSDAYDLPNVPHVMYFYHDFGLHGAYWHNNFGYTMSHGCVNMRLIDAKTLFEWADGPTAGNKGTAVSICNQFTPPNNCIQDNPVN